MKFACFNHRISKLFPQQEVFFGLPSFCHLTNWKCVVLTGAGEAELCTWKARLTNCIVRETIYSIGIAGNRLLILHDRRFNHCCQAKKKALDTMIKFKVIFISSEKLRLGKRSREREREISKNSDFSLNWFESLLITAWPYIGWRVWRDFTN